MNQNMYEILLYDKHVLFLLLGETYRMLLFWGNETITEEIKLDCDQNELMENKDLNIKNESING